MAHSDSDSVETFPGNFFQVFFENSVQSSISQLLMNPTHSGIPVLRREDGVI